MFAGLCLLLHECALVPQFVCTAGLCCICLRADMSALCLLSQLTPASSLEAQPMPTWWVWTCPPTVTPWCTPVSPVIFSQGAQSTVFAAPTAAGLARFLCAGVRCYRKAGWENGKCWKRKDCLHTLKQHRAVFVPANDLKITFTIRWLVTGRTASPPLAGRRYRNV